MDNKNKLVFGYLNIEILFAISSNYWVNRLTEVTLIYETKVDYSFHIGNFLIDDLFNDDDDLIRDSKGRSIMLFVREDIQLNLPGIENKPTEGPYITLNLQNDNWLIGCSYNPHKDKSVPISTN